MNKDNNGNYSSHNNNGVDGGSEIQLNKVFQRAFYHWPLYLLITFFAFIAAWSYLRYTKPVYVSFAKIYIKDENKAGASRQTNALDAFALIGGSKLAENEMEIIRSPLILEDVIRNNKFNIRYFEKGKVSDFELYERSAIKINVLTDSSQVGNYDFEIIRINDSDIEVKYKDESGQAHLVKTRFNQAFNAGKDRFSFTYYPLRNPNNFRGFQVKVDSVSELAYSKAAELRTVLVNNKSSVFFMIYEDVVPKRAADFLNAVAERYNEYTLEDKNLIALNTIKFIESRLDSLGGELGAIEKDVEVFKQSRGITQINESSRLYLEQAKEADLRLDEANIQLSVYNQIEKYLNNADNGAPLTPLIGNIDASLTTVINTYQNLINEKKRLSLTLQPDNPIQQNLDQQIADTRNTIRKYISGYRQNASTTKSGLQRKVNEIEGQISKVPAYERQFINLERQQSVKNALYLFLLQKKEESAVSYASNIVDNKIISRAYVPRTPIRPKKIIVLIGFIVAGFILTSLYLIIKYMMSKKVTSKKDIEKLLPIPVVAEIFIQEQIASKSFFESKNRSVLAEQMLNLRTNLKFLLNDVRHTPVILLTSSISGEGKTFLSAHLGNSLRGNNKRVVLIELDLRKPKLAKTLGMSNESGITNYIVGIENIDQIIKKVPDTENLYLIPSGPIPPNPVELIESEKMRELFAILRKQFDYIIVDTAPAGLVSDARALIPEIDCALFVVRFNYTPKAKLSEVADSLENASFRKIGLIFNGIEQGSSYGYYSYGYSNYGYGYGYYGGEVKKGFGTVLKKLKQRTF